MQNATVAPVTSMTRLAESHDCFFFFDFAIRYAVLRCGSSDTLDVAIMSTMLSLPLVVWVTLQILMLFVRELYIFLYRWTISILFVLQFTLLFIMQVPPPVIGCGPHRAYPNAQTSLCSYIMVASFSYYHTYKHVQQTLVSSMTITIFILVTHSVLYIGFADAASCLAGSILGGLVASSFHTAVACFDVSSQQSRISTLASFTLFLRQRCHINIVNTMLARSLSDTITNDTTSTDTSGQNVYITSTSGAVHEERGSQSPCAQHPLCMGYELAK